MSLTSRNLALVGDPVMDCRERGATVRRTALKGQLIRKARIQLGWSQHQLADRACQDLQTIEFVEDGAGAALWNYASEVAIRLALEAGGIRFVEGNIGISGMMIRIDNQ